jgi:agmatinase
MRSATILAILLALGFPAGRAWEFPPVAVGPAGKLEGQHRLSVTGDDDVNIVTGSRFHGLKTFANLPYVFCFAEQEETAKYDIAILGAPFDTVRLFDPLT